MLDPGDAVDPAGLASAYLGCLVVPLHGLTDRHALEYLEREWGIDCGKERALDFPQSGGLYVAENGQHRWIFVEATEAWRRQRFTVGHEIGHLVREAIPRLEQLRADAGELLPSDSAVSLLRFGRCALQQNLPLTRAAKLELDAHDFAAELLMPVEGVRKAIRDCFPSGVCTGVQARDLVKLLVDRYEVSWEAAERRVHDDFGIHPSSADPNGDLFAESASDE